jgi:hypothetical protein
VVRAGHSHAWHADYASVVRESVRIGPSGIPERLFYPHRMRVRDLGDTFGAAIWLFSVTAFLWFSVGVLLTPAIGPKSVSLINPFFIFVGLVWAVSFGYLVMALNELLLARPFYFFVGDANFGFQDRRGRHEWDRKLLRSLVRNWIKTSGEQGLDGRPGGYKVLRFMGYDVKPGRNQSFISFWRLATSRWDRSAPGALCSLRLSNWDNPEYLALVEALGVPLEVR